MIFFVLGYRSSIFGFLFVDFLLVILKVVKMMILCKMGRGSKIVGSKH